MGRGKSPDIHPALPKGFRSVDDAWGSRVRLMANDSVKIEDKAVNQALAFARRDDLKLREMVLTPDLHPGSPIPVGVVADLEEMVYPKMIGRDIGCGMRLIALPGIDPELVTRHKQELTQKLRHVFFEGARGVLTSPNQREAIFRDGLYGLHETVEDNLGRGVWAYYNKERAEEELMKSHNQGGFSVATRFSGYERYVRSSERTHQPDPQLGSLGGGNHFLELDVIEDTPEGATAHAWGVQNGTVVIFVHTGSLSIGHAVGVGLDVEDKVLEVGEEITTQYLEAMSNAANFAFANRLCLSLMAQKCIHEVTGVKAETELVYDAPHNFIEKVGEVWRHRKGATPAEGATQDKQGSSLIYPSGKPVLIPGSMGAASWVLAGEGSQAALESTAHGAGRALSRGNAARGDTPENITVVTPVDIQKMRSMGRHDIADEAEKRVREESPHAYKSIEAVVQSVEEAGAARRVARLKPLLTVKG